MMNYFKMAYRNLGRHRRRSILSGLALALGTALLMFIAAFFQGEMRSSMETTLRLNSGHIQVQDADYDPDKLSVAWEYLIENPEQVAAQIEAMDQVQAATPRLFASGIVSGMEESIGVQIMGIVPDSEANAPYRDGLVSGQFLTVDDREGIVIGYPLAKSLGLKVGDLLNLLVNTSEGNVDEQKFTVRGIFSTGTTAYDKGIVFLPLAKAQAFSGAQNHASMIFILLKDREQADVVAAAIQGSGYQVKTWTELNELLVLVNDFSNAYLAIINAKTAALFSAAAEVGAAIAGRPPDERAALKSYGKNLGLAFQLHRDLGRARATADIMRKLYTAFYAAGASLMEINPLATTPTGHVVALDAKIVIDDNELDRRPEIAVLRDISAEAPSEVQAREAGLTFIKLEGTVGCCVNGAGLAMATMDLVKYYGGAPANFLDIGGSSNPQKVVEALKIITADPHVRAILFNIFGGITRCDDVANGIVAATKQFEVKVPIVIRLTGTNEEKAVEILKSVGMSALTDMDEAVKRAVAVAKGGKAA